MSIEVKAQPLKYPKEFASPANVNSMISTVAQFTRYFISSEYRLCIKGVLDVDPAPQDRNKVLFSLDGAGRPVRVSLFYNGNWRRVYSGLPTEIKMYVGAWTTNFDATGLGRLGGNWDGWALCNGNNGTLNFTDRFVISGNFSIGGGWYTYLGGAAAGTGGVNSFQIQLGNLPAIPLTLNLSHSYADGGLQYAISSQQGTPIGGGPTGLLNVATIGTGAQVAISTLPVYVAMGFAQFIGYQN